MEAPPPTKWQPLTVVGVVPGVTRHGLNTYLDYDPNAGWHEIGQYYRPWGTWSGLYTYVGRFFAVHTQGAPTQLADAVRREIHLLDSAVVPSEFSTMEDSWLDFSAERRFYMVILNIFGLNALILAAVGIYGVTAFSVAQRTHEIGVRIALGAGASQIFRMVAGEGLRLVAIGSVIGVCTGYALSRFLRSMLFQVSERDPITFTITVSVLVTSAAFACYLPAHRATKLDPWTVLRVE
jgi:ABC-type antimicrobial peptide transport system permease subunit